MSERNDSSSRRTSVLTYLLVGGVTLAFLVFLVVVTAGFFMHVITFAIAITCVGSFHYLVWGKFLSDHFAKEMEEARLLEQARDEGNRPGANRTARDGITLRETGTQGTPERRYPRSAP